MAIIPPSTTLHHPRRIMSATKEDGVPSFGKEDVPI